MRWFLGRSFQQVLAGDPQVSGYCPLAGQTTPFARELNGRISKSRAEGDGWRRG